MTTPVELIKRLSRPLEPIPTGAKPEIPEDISGIRAFIFDIYGTLFISSAGDIGKDSASHSVQAFEKALIDAGITLAENQKKVISKGPETFRQAIIEHHSRMHDRGIEFPEVDICDIWTAVLKKLGIFDPDRISGQQIELLSVSYECRTNPVWPMPGARRLIEGLSEAGKTIGIISNAQFYTPLMFQALLEKSIYDMGFSPDLCLFSWKEGVAKPSLSMFQKVSERLDKHGIDGDTTLYIGNDMLKDVLPAHEVRWKTALFAGDIRSLRLREDDPRIKGLRPWCTVTALEQLLV